MEMIFFGLLGIGFVFLGPIAFFMVLGARSRLDLAERKMKALEVRLADVERSGLAPRARATDAEFAAPQAPPPTPPEALQPAPIVETPVPPETRAADAAPDDVITSTTPASTEAVQEPEPVPAVTEPISLPGGSLPPAESEPPVAPPAEEPHPQPVAATARKAKGPSFEERLGTRWAVWVGGLALAVGALLLVRQAILQGFFGPGMRIVTGLVFSAALIAAGEWLRRREQKSGDVSQVADSFSFGRPSIPAMLTAAGTVGAFGSVYAAHAIYEFIGPALTFIALGAIGIATMLAASLHGPMLAGVGILGAMAAPLLVTSKTPSVWPVVLYMAIVAIFAYGLARLRRWMWLGLAAAAGGALWCGALTLSPAALHSGEFYHGTLAHVLIQSALALFFLCYEPWRQMRDEDVQIVSLPSVVTMAAGSLGLFVLASGLPHHFDLVWIVAAALLVAVHAASGLAILPAIAGVVVAGAGILSVMFIWRRADGGALPFGWRRIDLFPFAPPDEPGRFAVFAVVTSLALAAACAIRLLKSSNIKIHFAYIYAGVAVLTPLAALTLTYLRFTGGETSTFYALMACALGVVYGVAARILSTGVKSGEPAALNLGLGAFASGAIAALALALVLILDGGSLTVALALAAAGAALVSVRLDIPALRWCVVGFGLAVAARYLWEPRISSEIGTTPLFNWLLFGYGIPAAAFGLSAWIMRKARGEDAPVRVATMLSIMCSALLLFFEIRHFMNGGNIYVARTGHIELGMHAIMSICFSVVLMQFDRRQPASIYRLASYAFNIASAAIAVAGLGFVWNPFVTPREIIEGGTIFNSLILGYGLPALAYAGAVTFMVRNHFNDLRRHISSALAIGFAAIYAFGELRWLMSGGALGAAPFTLSEIGLNVCLAIAFIVPLLVFADRKISPVFVVALRLFALLAALLTIGWLALLRNPLFPNAREAIDGGWLINALLPGYFLPALAFAGAAWFFRRRAADRIEWQIAAAFSVLCFALYVHCEVHLLMNNAAGTGQIYRLAELGVHALVAMGFVLAILKFAVPRSLINGGRACDVFSAIAAIIAVAGAGLYRNPLFVADSNPVEGGLAFNALMLAYLAPGIAALVIARLSNQSRPHLYVSAMRILGIALVFAYLSLQVRRIYQGANIHLMNTTGDTEWYTYSIVWLLFGIVLLAYGLWRRSIEVRAASAIFIVLSVIKVFMFDLSGLEGVLRALSFIGLGLVLIGIGLVYQKFVFVRRADTQTDLHDVPPAEPAA